MRLPIFQRTSVATTPQVDALIRANHPVAVGVSGGKDSTAVAYATVNYLNRVKHTGPRVLIHSDLGRVEWADSLPTCKRLAASLGLELVVVRRASGDMMDRWQSRWAANVERYRNLECVKLILPWSTPKMRFCTSELKTAVICRDLVKRFPNSTILSVTGIRREESTARAEAPIASVQNKLTSSKYKTTGYNWNPILDWSLADVWRTAEEYDMRHEAYAKYGVSRVSCRFCIMSSASDLQAAAAAEESKDLYVEMVELELSSTFPFQAKWLADVAPHLLTSAMRDRLSTAKLANAARVKLESDIPKHLEYVKGWPTVMPTPAEATLIANVRRGVGALIGLPKLAYTDGPSVLARYKQLMDEKAAA